MTVHVFHVEMTCEGCSNAVQRILDRHQDKGIGKYKIELEKKTVSVETELLTSDEVGKILEKCGKDVCLKFKADNVSI